MPVPATVQAAISARYLALSTAVLNGDRAAEARIYAPHFRDARHDAIPTFEYDQLTVIVGSIDRHGNAFDVHATYYGAHGRKIKTVDRWITIDGQYRLMSRT